MRKTILCIIAATIAILTAAADDNRITTCEYWVDNGFAERALLPVSDDGRVSCQFDFSNKSEGVHSIAFRFGDSNGLWSFPLLRHFVRVKESHYEASSLTNYTYWIDGKKEEAVTGNCANGVINLQLNMSNLTPGVHNLTYMVGDDKGLYTNPVMRHFIVPYTAVPEGVAIAGYQYWFNYGPRTYVEVDPQSTLTLTDVTIQVGDVEPIRISSDYQFIPEDLSVLFPQSDIFFGMQAIDNVGLPSGAVISSTVQADLAIHPEFRDLSALKTETVVAPAGGKMAGFKSEVNVGDLILLTTDRMLSVDIFDMLGNRIEVEQQFNEDTELYEYRFKSEEEHFYILMHSAPDAITPFNVNMVIENPVNVDFTNMESLLLASVNGGIIISTPEDKVIDIYTMTGIHIDEVKAEVGKTFVALPAGTYIAKEASGKGNVLIVK